MNAQVILVILAIGAFAYALINEAHWSRAVAAGLLFSTLATVVH